LQQPSNRDGYAECIQEANALLAEVQSAARGCFAKIVYVNSSFFEVQYASPIIDRKCLPRISSFRLPLATALRLVHETRTRINEMSPLSDSLQTTQHPINSVRVPSLTCLLPTNTLSPQ
jgi:hypothetical protein